jgi:GT2 family glycosyltransferase
VRIQTVEASEPPSGIDLRSADEWRILLELNGTACAELTLPNPGKGAGPDFFTAAVLRHADGHRVHAQFVADMRRRLGAPGTRTFRERSCSVVICTHRRPAYLQGALVGAMNLDPAPLEVIVVDNDPGALDCRETVERAGARYVREDRRGLNVARATGARLARGELVAYLDDDCVPSRHWLGQLPELFSDPLVAAVTGPAFAFALKTPSQRRRDAIAGFVHGLGRRTYDWTVLRPVHSGRVGAGANMIFRRDRLVELGEPFPADLDAGTATLSGGDLYALYRVLAAGYRITYDPATFVFHRHRADPEALRGTVRGYGIGAAAYLTKTLVEEREPATFAIWRWLPQQYVIALVARAVGRGDAQAVRLRWEYMSSSFRGPGAWLEARAAARSQPRVSLDEPHVAADPASVKRIDTNVSVVIAGDDPAAVERCRAALAGQASEVIHSQGVTRAAQRNAGAREATGEILVFIDAEVVPAPDLVTRHLERLRADDAPDVVLGYCPSRPAGALAAKHDALVWEDHFSAKRDAIAFTSTDVVASNMSVRREVFERVGVFDERIGAFDDWEWGARALGEGVRFVFDESAVAPREPLPVSVLERIDRAREQGRAEVTLAGRHAVSLAAGTSGFGVRLLAATLDRGGGAVAALLLDVLESLRARRAWLRLFRIALGSARRRGWQEAGGRGAPGAAAAVVRIELDADGPIPAPGVSAPVLELHMDGEPLARLAPRRAQWHGGLAEEIARVLARLWWPEREVRWWTSLPGAAAVAQAAPESPDVSGILVLFGPGSQPNDRRDVATLVAAGASVREAGGALPHWDAIDREIRDTDTAVAALPLPGVAASSEWLRAVAPAFEGSRVAAVVGVGLLAEEPAGPLFIHSRTTLTERYPTGLRNPFQYIAVRTSVYRELGGFDREAAECGHLGPVLDYLERALSAGYLIGYRETVGLDPPGRYRPARAANDWARWSAAGGLLARDARRTGGMVGWGQFAARVVDGIWPRLVFGQSRRWWLGTRLALLIGAARAVARRRTVRSIAEPG